MDIRTLGKLNDFLTGFVWGAGMYVVADYLWFHYYDPVEAAERILDGDSE